jgi:hypothetical protein
MDFGLRGGRKMLAFADIVAMPGYSGNGLMSGYPGKSGSDLGGQRLLAQVGRWHQRTESPKAHEDDGS